MEYGDCGWLFFTRVKLLLLLSKLSVQELLVINFELETLDVLAGRYVKLVSTLARIEFVQLFEELLSLQILAFEIRDWISESLNFILLKVTKLLAERMEFVCLDLASAMERIQFVYNVLQLCHLSHLTSTTNKISTHLHSVCNEVNWSSRTSSYWWLQVSQEVGQLFFAKL